MKRSTRFKARCLATTALLLCLSAAPATNGKPVKVTIDNLKYNPAKVTIAVGQTVQWINKDDHDHTVVAKNEEFDSDNLGRDDTFKYTFTKPGKYEYFCRYHPRMKGLVIVEE
jgi:plastocyanin